MSIKAMKVSRRLGLHSTPVNNFPESASQTFLKGAVLVASSSRVQEGGANPAAILGIANAAGKNLGAGIGRSDVSMAIQSLVFEGTLNDGSDDYTSLAADLLQEFGITKDGTTNHWFVDKSKTGANGRVRVIRFVDPVGTVDARVDFVFSMDATLLDKT